MVAFSQVVKNTFIEFQPTQSASLRRCNSDSSLSYSFADVAPASPRKLATRWADIEDCSTDEEFSCTGSASSSSNGDDAEQRAQMERALARDLAEQGAGLPTETVTVMVRHVPNKYNQKTLMCEIEESGFQGQFDFFYLPMNMKTNKSRGFAFINFKSAAAAQAFYEAFHDKALRQHSAQAKVLSVVPADVQGFEATAAQYVPQDDEPQRRKGCRPVFLR
jgi:RNA recognition motif-containing protein